ncbi:MAG: hypothetical protein ACI9N9_000388 [Enterobacterales bacterium]|jgi:hypothetical protein
MKKTDKKIDNSVRDALTEVCEIALNEVAGFQWITHFANYKYFPDSLSVVCIFDTDNDLSNLLGSDKDDYLHKLIKEKLSTVGIHIKNISQQVSFDTEEACKNEHSGKWQERFNSTIYAGR